MVPFALGTQTGGSMIRPAAYCGVVGFKPTFGAVPREGMNVLCPSLDVIGWHARDLEMAQRVGAVLLPAAPAAPSSRSARPKIGFLRAHPGYTPESSALEALDRARVDLLEAGFIVEPVEAPPCAMQLLQAHSVVMHYEFARALAATVAAAPHLLSERLLATVQRGQGIPETQYGDMRQWLESPRGAWRAWFGDADLVLTTGALGPAPLGLAHTGESAFNKGWSALGWPCMSLPTARDAGGLPLGTLLVGPPGCDRQMLSWAEAVHPAIDRSASQARAPA